MSACSEFRKALGLGHVLLLGLGYWLGPETQAAGADSRPNVLVITIDTLRADHLGCYGDRQIETAHIDQLARQSARFTHAYTPVPITLPAHVALFTGAFPMATGIHDYSVNRLSANAATLAKVLNQRGYTTAAFIGAAVLESRFGLKQGFQTYSDNFKPDSLHEAGWEQWERRGDQVMDLALQWLKRSSRRPFFLWVHLYDPHFPYRPPEPYASRYGTHPYDGEIAFADEQVGRLVSLLKQEGLFDSSLLVLVADHGESLGEHGEKTHGFFLYNSTLHIPLLIKVPGAVPRVVADEVSLVDVMPTILQALGIPRPDTVQGRSLLGCVLGRPGAASSGLYAETYVPLLHFHWSQLRALQSHGLKYIDAPRPELYNTRADPQELHNLFQSQHALGLEMRERLYNLIRRFTPRSASVGDEKELTDTALVERLRSLGYVALSAGSIAEAGGKSLSDPKDHIEAYELVSDAMADGEEGRHEEALRKLRRAKEIDPNLLPVHYLMGLNYFRLKDFRRAEEELQSTLAINPRVETANFYLGLSQMEMGELEGATASLHQALEQDPTNFLAAFYLGACHMKSRRYDEAARDFARTVQINNSYEPGYEALGELYLYQGHPLEAARALERALALSPDAKNAHYTLGRAYEDLGRAAEAKRQFDLAGPP